MILQTAAESALNHRSLTAIFVVAQLVVLVGVLAFTWRPLSQGRATLKALRDRLLPLGPDAYPHAANAVSTQSGTGAEEVKRAWDRSLAAQRTPDRRGGHVDPEVAFDPAELLPGAYNPRLDAAAPGLFMAIGIMGTFTGLILGFNDVDPNRATDSIGQLIGGMSVAFINSLIGVLLSSIWSGGSRVIRHGFDRASKDLRHAAEKWYRPAAMVDQLGVLQDRLVACFASLELKMDGGAGQTATALESLRKSSEESLQALRESSEMSSKQLLEGLSPRLAESLQQLVTTPFQEVTRSVQKFDEIIRQAGERQELIVGQLDAAARSLATSQDSLASSITAAELMVGEFTISTDRLREGAEQVASVANETGAAALAIQRVAIETGAAADRYQGLGSALEQAVEGLSKTESVIRDSAIRFSEASAHLDQSVASVRALAESGVETSVAAVSRELQTAIDRLVSGIEESVTRSVAAHQAGTEEISRAVETQVTALVERVSTDLGQAAGALPEQVTALNQAMTGTKLELLRAYKASIEASHEAFSRSTDALTGTIQTQIGTLADRFPGMVEELSAAMERSHVRTLEAYEASSERVVEAIDDQLSDLIDRLSSTLATLTTRLPEEVSSIRDAMSQTTQQVRASTGSMNDALRQLAVQTPQAIAAQYKEFDSALGTAVRHFSGTLSSWDAKVEEIQRLSTTLAAFVRRLEEPPVMKTVPVQKVVG